MARTIIPPRPKPHEDDPRRPGRIIDPRIPHHRIVPYDPHHRVDPRDPRDPVNPGREIHIDVQVPCPWSPRQLEQVIENACRFIQEAKIRHGRQLGWEVGEYLYVQVYRQRDDYIRWNGRNKELSVNEIAPLVEIPALTLHSWLEAAMMRHAMARAGFTTPVPLSFSRGLYPLYEYVDEAVTLARWARKRGVAADYVARLARKLAHHLNQNGSIEDFLESPHHEDDPEPSPRKVATPDELVTERLFMLSCRWLEEAQIAGYLRKRLEGAALEIRASIDADAPMPEVVVPREVVPLHDSPGPAVDPPWTRSEQARILRRAVRYIKERVRAHEFDFAMEVGDHLFNGLFRGDRRLYHRGGRWKRRSIQAIASDPRVRISEHKLYACIQTYLLVRQFGKHAPRVKVPRFSIYKWEKLFVPLENDPRLVDVALWIEEEKVPRYLVVALARVLRPYLALGGDLDDLMPVAGKRGPDTTYRRLARMMEVSARYLAVHPLPDHVRERTIEAIDAFLATL